MNQILLRDPIIGSKTFKNIFFTIVIFFAGLGFFLAGLSSYFHQNFLVFTKTDTIAFLPQGITMLFYGTIALGIAFYLSFTIWWDVGSGYNEFSKQEQIIRIVRLGFPGKNRTLFLSYEFTNLSKIKLLFKQGLNPRYNVLLVLKDKREIPLFPPQFLLSPVQVEKKGIALAKFLNLPLETVKI